MKLTFSKNGHNTKHQLALPKHSFFHKIGRDFVIDWMLMISVVVVISAVFIAVGYIKHVTSNEIINTENIVQPTSLMVRFDDKKLDSTIDMYGAKLKARESVNNGEYKIIDPAL